MFGRLNIQPGKRLLNLGFRDNEVAFGDDSGSKFLRKHFDRHQVFLVQISVVELEKHSLIHFFELLEIQHDLMRFPSKSHCIWEIKFEIDSFIAIRKGNLVLILSQILIC